MNVKNVVLGIRWQTANTRVICTHVSLVLEECSALWGEHGVIVLHRKCLGKWLGHQMHAGVGGAM